MSTGPMGDAFGPLRGRMSQAIDEREILRVLASVDGDDPDLSMQQARREVLAWAQRRSGGKLPKQAWEGQGFDFLRGGRTTIGVRIDKGDVRIWSLRCDDPDKSVARRVWTTEITIGQQRDQSPQLGVRLLAASPEAELAITPHVPGFLRQIAARCGLSAGGFPVAPEPQRIATEADVVGIIAMLESQARRLPVVVASGDERTDDPSVPSIDAHTLAQATLGLAHVVALPATYSYWLSDAFGKIRSVFHGAVRVYLPGFSADSDPYAHPLYLADGIRADPKRCLRDLRLRLAEESVRRTRLGRDVLAFAAVRSAALRLEQEQRARSGASDRDQLDAALRRIKALEEEVEAARAEADQYFKLAETEEERAKLAETQLSGFRARIQVLESALASRGVAADEDLIFPETWSGFADWCDRSFAGRLVLAPKARRGVRKPEFEDAKMAGKCLHWLATTCRDRFIGGGGQLGNIPILNGLENAPCGNDEFDFEFQGRRLRANWHVKNGGNTRDPRRCLRIYYGFDDLTQQIVVADMPAHRRTGAT